MFRRRSPPTVGSIWGHYRCVHCEWVALDHVVIEAPRIAVIGELRLPVMIT